MIPIRISRSGSLSRGGMEPGRGPSLRTGRAWRKPDSSGSPATRSAQGTHHV